MDSWDPPAWATTKASVREQLVAYGPGGPDLTLLDGGINDFNALQVVLPWKLGGPDRACDGNTHSEAVERLLGAARAAGPGVAVTGRFELPALEEMTDAESRSVPCAPPRRELPSPSVTRWGWASPPTKPRRLAG